MAVTMVGLLQRQHREMQELLRQMDVMLAGDIAGKSGDLGMKLAELAGKVKVHLAHEDQMLYPSLAKREGAREIVVRFQREMGGLSEAFAGFRRKYGTIAAIKENPQQFAADLKRVAAALNSRIAAEERELLPLAE